MKSLLLSPFVLALAVLPTTLYSQKGTVAAGGTLTIALNQKFTAALNTAGVAVAYTGASATARGENFKVTSGSVRLANGVGSVESQGSLTFTEGDDNVSLQSFELLTNKDASYITAEVFFDGMDEGRFPIFTLTQNLFSAPVSYGKYTSGNVQFMVNPDYQSEFGDYLRIDGLKPDAILGNFSMSVNVTKN